ncbi:MAG: glycosyltransferase family 2 protein [Candidatus Paceibacterota bacterium]|jgi:glycosyltransferase involved in cell wall biosynthesis
MKLSIIIPAYNEEVGLADCLKMVLSRISEQNREVETILVNNASTDRTREIAELFSNIKIVDESNKGLVRARQAGFMASIGDLIANVDADSRIPAGWIEKIFTEFERNPNLVALSGPYIYYDLPWWFNWLSKIYYWLGWLSTYLNLNPARHGAMLQGGNFVLRRTALEKIGGYRFEKFDFYGEETDVAMRICEVGKIKFTFGLSMVTSGRRLATEGMLRVSTRYAVNYFWTIFLGRPYTQKNIDIRATQKPSGPQ